MQQGCGGIIYFWLIPKAETYRLLFLASWYPSDAHPTLGNFVQRHAEAVALCHRVTVLYLAPDNTASKLRVSSATRGQLTEHILYFPTAGNRRRNQWKAFDFGLREVLKLKRGDFDLAHLNVINPAGWQALRLKRKFKIPFVVTEHWTGYHNGRAAQLPRPQRWLMRKVGRSAAVLCPVSEHLGKHMEAFGIRSRYRVVGNVVDTNLFQRRPHVNDIPRLIHVSHLNDDHKNISGMLRVLSALISAGVKIFIEFMGDGDIEPHIQTARELGIPEENYSFKGEQPLTVIAERMALADGLLLFSNYENMPCVIIEAMACGLPVISSDVGGISEHLTSDKGVLVPKGDEKALGDAIRFWLAHRSNYDAQALRAYAVDHFSQFAIAEAYTRVYTEVLQP